MTAEERIKATFGEMLWTQILLSSQIDDANTQMAALKEAVVNLTPKPVPEVELQATEAAIKGKAKVKP